MCFLHMQAHSSRTALLELMDRNTALDQKLRGQNHRVGMIIRDLQERSGVMERPVLEPHVCKDLARYLVLCLTNRNPLISYVTYRHTNKT